MAGPLLIVKMRMHRPSAASPMNTMLRRGVMSFERAPTISIAEVWICLESPTLASTRGECMKLDKSVMRSSATPALFVKHSIQPVNRATFL
jgi:hypothetical protein